jgi:hypothetical protein
MLTTLSPLLSYESSLSTVLTLAPPPPLLWLCAPPRGQGGRNDASLPCAFLQGVPSAISGLLPLLWSLAAHGGFRCPTLATLLLNSGGGGGKKLAALLPCPVFPFNFLSAVTPNNAVKPKNAVVTLRLRVPPPWWAVWLGSP